MMFAFGAYALGYILRARRVVTAAEARQRRQDARDEKVFKRYCKRHMTFMRTVASYVEGESIDLPFPGGVLHTLVDGPRDKEHAARLKSWFEHWDAITASYVPRQTSGVSPRHRATKYLRPNQPARYGSSKRGKSERAWANMMTTEQMMPGMFLHTATGPALEHQAKLVGFDPEVVGAVDTKDVHELFKSEIVPLVPKT